MCFKFGRYIKNKFSLKANSSRLSDGKPLQFTSLIKRVGQLFCSLEVAVRKYLSRVDS
jgi:hypothetical protein